MQYRIDVRSGNKLSALGLGCMRFKRTATGAIDYKKAEKTVLSAIGAGVNYLDTAYVYMGSEEVLGQIFKNNPGTREKIFLATKLPHYQCKTNADFDKLFNIQLEKLNTDHIDYYLIHNLPVLTAWERIVDLGITDWIRAKKSEGKIKQLGFSFHGAHAEFLALLDAYDWDFCQIQYNYINTSYQAGTAGLKAAAGKNIPVIVMEPLLGGKLAAGLPKEALKLFNGADDRKTPAAWALEWLWNQPEVTFVLSGMNTEQQVLESAAIASGASAYMFGEREAAVFNEVTSAFNRIYAIPCTGCNYCMPCPNNVNIPACFASFNMRRAVGFVAGMSSYMTSTAATSRDNNSLASRCTGCKKCEKHCPQHIEIAKRLIEVRRRMEPFWFKAGITLFNAMRR